MAKTIEEIKSKLQKLFAMMEENSGASQQEVETAMVKARKLMAEYKLTKSDVIEEKVREVITKCFSNIEFTTTTDPWIINLVHVIADNYCCHACMYSIYNSRRKRAGLIGFEDDVETAARVLNYAVDSIRSENERIKKAAWKKGIKYAETTAMANAYGSGFVQGIREAFEEQNKSERETGFAMVMVTPQEVKDYVNDKCKKSSFNDRKATANARNYGSYAMKGYAAGKNFNMGNRIAG